MSTRPGSTHAFTLLELLVVVAVLGLLLAILMPALSAASEAGRSAVCGTNLNQLFHGSFAYSEANNERLPWYGGNGPPEGYEWWVTQVAHGMEEFEPEIYQCPSDPTPRYIHVYHNKGTVYKDRGSTRGRTRRLSVKLTYRGSCDLLVQASATDTTLKPRKVTSWARPERAILLIEGYPWPNYSPALSPYDQSSCFRFGALGNMARGRHNQSWNRHFGTTNVLFMDGHVSNHIPRDIGFNAKQQEHRL